MWQTGATMLIELWERLRGYDKWVETDAKIQSSNLSEEQIAEVYGRSGVYETVSEWQSTNTIMWTDASGKEHSAEYEVDEDSPLFQLYDGQTVTIRYNPANPDEFYLRGLASSHAGTFFKGKFLPFM
jgi:hypothetical protein